MLEMTFYQIPSHLKSAVYSMAGSALKMMSVAEEDQKNF
jgi:hypothetical protein